MHARILLTATVLVVIAAQAAATDLSRLPLRFEPAADGRSFVAGRLGCDVRVTATRVELGATTLRLVGGREAACGGAEETLPGRSTYLFGNDPTKWRKNVPQSASVRFRDVYPGIDVVHHGRDGQLEHDFVVAPGADAARIRLALRGATLSDEGDIVAGEVRVHAPCAYQDDAAGARREVACRYVRLGRSRFGVEVGAHDTSRELVIDPVISWSTYVTGDALPAWNNPVWCGMDPDGSAWMVGQAEDSAFPHVGPPPPLSVFQYVIHVSAAGDALLSSTFMDPFAGSAARDPNGNFFLCGPGQWVTTSFPLVNAWQSEFGDLAHDDAYLMKLDPTAATILWSTLFGGPGREGEGSVADGVYVTTTAGGQPILAGMVIGSGLPTQEPLFASPPSSDGTGDVFVAEFQADGQSLVFSTYLGGSADDFVRDVAVDAGGNIVVVGSTVSSDFPAINAAHAFPPEPSPACSRLDCYTAFAARLSAAGTSIVYSTALGDGRCNANGVAVDPLGNAVVVGPTVDGDLEIVNPLPPGQSDPVPPGIFVARLSYAGVLEQCTTIGGLEGDFGSDVALDPWGRTIVIGGSRSDDFPVIGSIERSGATNGGAVLARLVADGSHLDFATAMGGLGSDFFQSVSAGADGSFAACGITRSTDFPTTRDTLMETRTGTGSAGVLVRFVEDPPPVREPSAIDVRDVPPFTIDRGSGGSLVLTWEETLGIKHGLYVGTLGSLWRDRGYDHVLLDCDFRSSSLGLPTPPGDVYFLIVDRYDGVESSYGRDSFRRERPASKTPCP